MALKEVDSFGQYQGYTGVGLAQVLAYGGYTLNSAAVDLVEGRHTGTHAIELQVSSGAAGISWSNRTNVIKNQLLKVAANSNRYCMVGAKGNIYTTDNTILYTPRLSGTSQTLRGVAVNGNTWVAVGGVQDDSVCIYSTDNGVTWNPASIPDNLITFTDVTYGGDAFVAIGSDYSGARALISYDGITWLNIDKAQLGTFALNDISYGNGYYVIVGANGTVRYSPNGLTWAAGVYGENVNIRSVSYGDGRWLAITGRKIRYSEDNGANWLVQVDNLGSINDSFIVIRYFSGTWSIVSSISGRLFTSYDRLAWTLRTTSGGTPSQSLRDVTTRNNGGQVQWFAVGDVIGVSPNNRASIKVSLAPPTTMTKTYTSNAQRVVFGFAMSANQRGKFFSIDNILELRWPGGIELGVSTTASGLTVTDDYLGAAVPIRNFWYYYEVTIDKTAGKVYLHINNTLDIEADLPVAANAINTFTVTWSTENGAVTKFSDTYFLDSTTDNGATKVNRIGPITSIIRLPKTDQGTNDWGVSDNDAPSHASLVNEIPLNDQSWLVSPNSGDTELFLNNDELPESDTPPTIIAVSVSALARKSDLDNRQIGLLIGSSLNQEEIIDTELSTSPEYSHGVFEKAPDGSNWDENNIISTPFGIRVRP